MGYLTYGHLNLTARRVGTEVTIDKLRAGMRRRGYPGSPPTRGWGALRWRNETEDAPGRDRSNPGSPSIEDFGEYRVLLARLFIDRLNRTLLNSVGNANFDGFSSTVKFNVEQVDVAIVEGQSLYVLIASHDDDDVNAVLADLKLAARPDDDDWSVGPMPKIEPDSDLYRWLLYRWDEKGGSLSSTLKLIDFKTLTTRDSMDHVSRELSGIDLSRVDTLGAIAEAHALGPAKLVLLDTHVKMRADLFLLRDGAFDVHRSGTEYEAAPMDKAQLGIYAALDVATKVLPRLHNAYANDRGWPTARPLFIDRCRQALADRFK